MDVATDRFERRLSEEFSGLRAQMLQMEARLTDSMSGLIPWLCLFWIGQVVTMTAIMSVLLRAR